MLGFTLSGFVCRCQCDLCMSAFEVARKESLITSSPHYQQHLPMYDRGGFDMGGGGVMCGGR